MIKSVLNGIKRHPLEAYMIFLVIAKMMLAGGMSIYAIGTSIHDDQLMVDMAGNLLEGNWLGAYDNRRLIKGITFPVYLAINHMMGIPFLMSVTGLYGIACGIFTNALQKNKLVNRKWLLAIIFTVLFFSPVNGCTEALQRVYRNSLIPALVMVVFTCFINMYFSRKESKVRFLLWSVCAGFSFAAFWNTREDSIWLLPFACGVSLITIVMIFLERASEDKHRWYKRVAVAVLPFLVLGAVNTGIKGINQIYYGEFIRNELSEGSFPDLMKAIYSVESEEDIFRTTVTRSTVEKIYEASPTFAQLKPALDANYGAGWDRTDGTLDGQIMDGWFFWCLRDCIVASGHGSTATDLQEFCAQAAQEINAALASGKLDKREGMVMPSALMSPWKDRFSSELPGAVLDAFWFIAKNEMTDISDTASVGTEKDIEAMEAMTHNLAIPQGVNLSIQGWMVSEDDGVAVSAGIYQGDQCIAMIARSGGEDIYDYFVSNGIIVENAKNSRFQANVEVSTTDNLQFVIFQDGVEVDRKAIEADMDRHGAGEKYQWHIDVLTMEECLALKSSVQPRIQVYRFIGNFYREIGGIVTVLGLVAYAFLSVYLLLRRKQQILDKWLISTALLCSVIVLCIGVGYTHISAYAAITSLYLVGGYPLLLSFNIVSIIFALQAFRKGRK